MKKLLLSLLAIFPLSLMAQQPIVFADYLFKESLLLTPNPGYTRDAAGNPINLDVNHDGQIDTTEALACHQLIFNNVALTDMTGIAHFTNLQKVSISQANLPSFDTSGLNQLEELLLNSMELTSVNFGTGLPNLEVLDLFNTNVEDISLGDMPNLRELNISSILVNFNGLTIANLPSLVKLEAVGIRMNPDVSVLNLNNLPLLEVLNLNLTRISQININNSPLLREFHATEAQFVELDFSPYHYLELAILSGNYSLENLNVKNGSHEELFIHASFNSLVYICADDYEIDGILSVMSQYPNAMASINTYCSFTPGGDYTTVTGLMKWDPYQVGCTNESMNIGNIKLQAEDLNNSDNSTVVFGNANSGYRMYLQEGNYRLSASAIDNPNFFNIAPAPVNINAPATSSEITQNFCVTPNGNQNDVEIQIFPIVDPRPGFTATYLVVLKNVGNMSANGTVQFNYNSSLQQFSAFAPYDILLSTNPVRWQFAALHPYQTRGYYINLNINSPTATNPVNNGNILNYSASLTMSQSDINPSNNNATLQQIVRGSYDPNDMVCLSGENIGVNQVGDYVYYRIRFENTGTHSADFVVINNKLDKSKFDTSSLTPIIASHQMHTELKYTAQTAQAEFLFENINLSHEDLSNDGYLIYKIRTINTLVNGDTFSNQADIYFDHNHPITTNNYVTTVGALGISDTANMGISLWPNPTKNQIHINAATNESVSIYNLIGQRIQQSALENGTLNVSNLQSGMYVLEMTKEGGKSQTKFIKN